MRTITVFVMASTIAVVLSADTKYTTRFDNVDIDRILSNERLIQGYIKCMMEEGPCTPEGKELKKTLPDALASGCDKCNPKQKQTSEKVIKHLTSKRPRDWERLAKKYDPEGKHKKRYEGELTKIKNSKQ